MKLFLPTRAAAALSAVVLISFLAACGGGDNPGNPGPAPSPSPSAAPTTPPPPSPKLPGQASCERIGLGTLNADCPRTQPSFQVELDRAIDATIAAHPEAFAPHPLGLRVVSPGKLLVGVIENLDRQGLCADFDGEEIQVKNSNAFNDQYHLITSNFILRRGASSYRATCIPATFPTPAPPLTPTPGCNIAPSRSITCTREEPLYLAQVDHAIDIVARDHPEVFNFNRVQAGTNWFQIVDFDNYFRFMVQAMTQQGFCAMYDGEELAVKRENAFNEQYDIFAGDGFIRRGEGSYRSTCYPATF
jgi:hypothetical protein